LTLISSELNNTLVESFRAARDQYKPGRVKLLWIAESPPTSGSYFYFPKTTGQDHLFRETMRAVGIWPSKVVMKKGVDKRPLLQSFRSKGFFLIDTCSHPVDKLKDRERKRAILEGTSGVLELVSELNPNGVIIVKSNIYDPVKRALESSGFAGKILNQKPLPFPSHGRQQSYRKRISDILRKLRV
jgi:hypothetical protein